jgi:hypothetical protein
MANYITEFKFEENYMAELKDENYEVSVANGVATVGYTDEGAFTEGCEVSKADMKKVFDHAGAYIAKVTEAASEKATSIMTEDKSVDKVVFAYPYGMSKRGSVDILANRSQTFRNIKDGSDVVKSTLRVAVKDPLTKASKSSVKALEAKMTASLLS